MTESNLKEMMIDDINEEAEEETTITETTTRLAWYLIDRDRTFCTVWNFMITLIIIYTLFVTPFVLIFPTVYEWCESSTGSEIDGADWENCTGSNIKRKSDTLY
jgi:hypothetical protein